MAEGVELDTKAFERGLKDALKRIEEGTRREVKRVGGVAEGAAKSTIAVDTGESRGTIRLSDGEDKRGPYVKLTAGGASLVLEYGTIHMEAQPFLRQAMRRVVQELKSPI